jgi:plastocyanin
MMNVLKYGLVVALSVVLLSGCGKTEEKKPGGGGPAGGGGAPEPDNTVEVKPDPATVGSIKFTAKLKGTAPARAPIDMSDADCAAAHASDPALDESVVPGSGGTLQNVMVWIDSGLDAKYVFKAPSTPVVIDQNGCMYKPHVITMMTKQSIEVKNSDGVQHNIHATPKLNTEFNFSQAPKTSMTLTTGSQNKCFTKVEVPFRVKCEIHGWMGATVGVFKHPYHGVTGADGTVSMKDVPPGTYTLKVWHEKYAKTPVEVQVTVKEKGEATASIELGE